MIIQDFFRIGNTCLSGTVHDHFYMQDHTTFCDFYIQRLIRLSAQCHIEYEGPHNKHREWIFLILKKYFPCGFILVSIQSRYKIYHPLPILCFLMWFSLEHILKLHFPYCGRGAFKYCLMTSLHQVSSKALRSCYSLK